MAGALTPPTERIPFMTAFLAELVGTALLLLLGDAVVANVVLRRTKGEGSGWIVITWGWGMAVFVGVFVAARYSGAHLNPAVTLGLAVAGKFDWALVPGYLAAQMLGAALGAFLVWVQYYPHWAATEDRDAKLAVFCTGPAIRSTIPNFLSEVIGTFVLVLGVLYLASPDVGLGALDALPVGLLVLVIGLSLGGTTGYAINPARDLAPRIMHAILPIPGGKRDSDWGYAWIPVAAPLVGAVLAALAFLALGKPALPLGGP
jgi:glycerol uptake facilitator protein